MKIINPESMIIKLLYGPNNGIGETWESSNGKNRLTRGPAGMPIGLEPIGICGKQGYCFGLKTLKQGIIIMYKVEDTYL